MKSKLSVKKDFPLFEVHPQLSYLDSTATSLKPQIVIDAINEYYSEYSANVHRGIYEISDKATSMFEMARQTAADFIVAESPEEIIFTRGTSEGLNLICTSLGKSILEEGDEIVTTIIEHHSNFVPWQQFAQEHGLTLKVAPVNQKGNVDVLPLISKKTKVLALTALSNVLGIVLPIGEISREAKKINPDIIIIVDAAQAAPHVALNVRDMACDALAFSGHKMCGPTGIGVLWVKAELLDKMPPYQYGGEMIQEVYLDHSTFSEGSHKFEAGTPHIAGTIGLMAAIKYLQSVGLESIHAHEMELADMCISAFREELGDSISILNADMDNRSSGIVTFNLKGVHTHDVAQILSTYNVAVRAGHHCAMPLHTHFGLPGSARASFYMYNTEDDVYKLVHALKEAIKLLG